MLKMSNLNYVLRGTNFITFDAGGREAGDREAGEVGREVGRPDVGPCRPGNFQSLKVQMRQSDGMLSLHREKSLLRLSFVS